jgi:hypothetical protein
MQSHSTRKVVLAVVLCVAMAATGCTAQWISVALADLPVLAQMALNIATLVATMQGRQVSSAEASAIQNISSAAYGGLNTLQMLYNQYRANPDAATLQKIQDVIAEIDRELPAQLQAAHIKDPALSAKVTAGVNLILTTVQSFAALLPSAGGLAPRRLSMAKITLPKAGELKQRWNQQVCTATANARFDAALARCAVK